MRTTIIFSALSCVLVSVSIARATPVPLQDATATFSQSGFTVDLAISGGSGGTGVSGWAISPDQGNDETAAFQTVSNVGGPGATTFTFTLIQDYGSSELLGDFRLAVTTANRGTFADGNTGVSTPGNVGASGIWTTLVPTSESSNTPGLTFSPQPDNSILVGGTIPAASIYTITANTALTGITGFRLETLADASLPGGGPGYASGNFVLQQFLVDATVQVPEPSTFMLLAIATAAAAFRRIRAAAHTNGE